MLEIDAVATLLADHSGARIGLLVTNHHAKMMFKQATKRQRR